MFTFRLVNRLAAKKPCRFYSNRNVLRLKERGLFNDIFPDKNVSGVVDLLNSAPQTVYAGFDPTASSLHVGNLLILVNLLHWQRSGHNVIVLMGGATARVGDPSGKSAERPELAVAQIDHNVNCIEETVRRIFANHEELMWTERQKLSQLRVVNNLEWYSQINCLDFIGRIGRHFRIGTMLGKQSVRDRMQSEQGMSFTEFTYQVLQAYDWFKLYKLYKCRFQIGGSDQMGNIVAGYDLIQRMADVDVFGLTLPLVTSTEGDKYGKTAGNAVWLAEEKTSAFDFYQFFVRSKDDEVEKLLNLFTFEPLGRIEEVMEAHRKNPEKRAAQKLLAESVTRLVHGEAGLERAHMVTSALYDQDIETLRKLNLRDLQTVFGGTTAELLLHPGMTVVQAAVRAGCFPTEKDAVRIITAGGFFINHQRVKNVEEVLSLSCHILPNKVSLMRVGKKNYTVVLWAGA